MADGMRGQRSTRWRSALRDAGGFVRDVLWLLGWGAQRLGFAARDNTAPGNLRGCFGCLGSALAVLAAVLFWRGRRR